METIKYVVLGIFVAILATFAFYWMIDIEVARSDYNKNVSLCKPIEGCLFSHNCNKYNKMIEEACND